MMRTKHRFIGLLCLVILLVDLGPDSYLWKDPISHWGSQTNLVNPNGQFPHRHLLDEQVDYESDDVEELHSPPSPQVPYSAVQPTHSPQVERQRAAPPAPPKRVNNIAPRGLQNYAHYHYGPVPCTGCRLKCADDSVICR